MMFKKFVVSVVVFAATLFGLASTSAPVPKPAPLNEQSKNTVPEKPPLPQITTKIPTYLPYAGIVEQLKTWNKEAPYLTQVGTYGKTSKGQDLYYIRIVNTRIFPVSPRK